MMEGENVKASTTIFQPTTTQGSASSPDSSSGACAAALKALTNLSDIRSKPWLLLLFVKKKKRALRRLAEARLRSGKLYGRWWHQLIYNATKKMSFTLRVKRILSRPGRTGSPLWATKEAKLPARNYSYSLYIFSCIHAVSYTHLRAHETCADLVCRLLLEKKNI